MRDVLISARFFSYAYLVRLFGGLCSLSHYNLCFPKDSSSQSSISTLQILLAKHSPTFTVHSDKLESTYTSEIYCGWICIILWLMLFNKIVLICVCVCEFSGFICTTIRTSLVKVLLKMLSVCPSMPYWNNTLKPQFCHSSVVPLTKKNMVLLATQIVLCITLTNCFYSLNYRCSSFWHVPVSPDLCLYSRASSDTIVWYSAPDCMVSERSTCRPTGILPSKLHKYRSKHQHIKETIRT